MDNNFQRQFQTAIQSGLPLIGINTVEMRRAVSTLKDCLDKWNKDIVEMHVEEFLKTTGYTLNMWDINQGWVSSANQTLTRTQKGNNDPQKALKFIQSPDALPGIYILKNFNLCWDDPLAKPVIIQDIIDIHEARPPYKHLFFVGSFTNFPPEIANLFSLLDFSLPTKEEFLAIVDEFKDLIKKGINKTQADKISDACLGMTSSEAEDAIRSAIVGMKGKGIDIEHIYTEKAKAVRRSGLLEYLKIDDTIDNVGGLQNIKAWLQKISLIFKDRKKAINYGLPFPKGCLILGISGTGKSLCAKATANLFDLPLFRCDVGRIFGGIVGETERNTRELFKLIDAVSPAIILLDEIEKSMAGLGSSDVSDSGVTSRFIGSFLYYMQEKKSPSFFMATANDVSKLPPELLRKGRFSEIWFVDLPTEKERTEIFKVHISKVKRDPSQYDIVTFAKITTGFTGAEIESVIIDAMYSAYYESREFKSPDIIDSIKNTSLLIRLKGEEIKQLRQWAKGRARPANELTKEEEVVRMKRAPILN